MMQVGAGGLGLAQKGGRGSKSVASGSLGQFGFSLAGPDDAVTGASHGGASGAAHGSAEMTMTKTQLDDGDNPAPDATTDSMLPLGLGVSTDSRGEGRAELR